MKSKVKRILNLEDQYKKVIARKNSIEKESKEITRKWGIKDWEEYNEEKDKKRIRVKMKWCFD